VTGAIYTWGPLSARDMLVWSPILEVMNRFKVDTVVDLRRPSSQLANPPDPNAIGKLYADARAGHRILLVCSHTEPRRCHRHAAIALPLAQDAANYAAARQLSPGALPIAPIEIWHVLGDRLVDPLEYEAATLEGREPKGKRWRR
jgi:hypothetical protein